MLPARERSLVIAFVLLGAALRAWQYGGGATLWLNEIVVARNVLDRSVFALVTQSLDYDQSAPPGYLLLTKASVAALGGGELPFRLPPFLASLAALALFPLAAYRLLEGRGAILATALMALAVPLVQHAAEVKQYSLDVLGTVVVLVVSLRWREKPTRANACVAAATGLAIVWFSNAAVLVLAGAGAALAAGVAIERRTGLWRQVAGIGIAWAIAAGAATAVARRMMAGGTHAFFVKFWRAGFLPDEPARWPGWLGHHLERLFGSELGYALPWVFVALLAAGLIALARRSSALLLVASPIIVTLVAAGMRSYPFGERLTLFLVPLFLLLVAAGADALLRPLRAPLRAAGLSLVVAAALGAAWRQRPVLRQQDVKPALAHMRAQWRAGDRLYVYSGAWQAAKFYGPRYGLHDAETVFGDCHRWQPRNLLAELDQFRGLERVWVFMTHAVHGFAERQIITSYLDTIGVRRDSLIIMPEPVPPNPSPVWVPNRTVALYLYDLSDPARRASTTAANFALPPIAGDERVDCDYGGSIPRPQRRGAGSGS